MELIDSDILFSKRQQASSVGAVSADKSVVFAFDCLASNFKSLFEIPSTKRLEVVKVPFYAFQSISV